MPVVNIATKEGARGVAVIELKTKLEILQTFSKHISQIETYNEKVIDRILGK